MVMVVVAVVAESLFTGYLAGLNELNYKCLKQCLALNKH